MTRHLKKLPKNQFSGFDVDVIHTMKVFVIHQSTLFRSHSIMDSYYHNLQINILPTTLCFGLLGIRLKSKKIWEERLIAFLVCFFPSQIRNLTHMFREIFSSVAYELRSFLVLILCGSITEKCAQTVSFAQVKTSRSTVQTVFRHRKAI